MTIETISEKVGALKRRYGEREPERLCQCMGIRVLYLPMGKEERACKGFFIKKSRIPLIVVNRDLPPEVCRRRCAASFWPTNWDTRPFIRN